MSIYSALLSAHLFQSGAADHGMREKRAEAGLGQEALLHVVVAVHPQAQLPDVRQAVGLQQPRDPGVIKGHAASHHLVGPVSHTQSLQELGLGHDDLEDAAAEPPVEVEVLE